MSRQKLNPVEREAHAWVRRLTSGEATLDDTEALNRWRSQSAAHAAAFAKASQLWDALGPAGRNILQGSGAVAALSLEAKQSPHPNRRALLGSGLAAAAAAGAGFAIVHPPLGLWPSWSELTADYRTGTGEQRQIVLKDNVAIKMNTQTSIALRPTQGGGSGIELISGEAAIATPAEIGEPLTVIASNGRMTASQARFEVRHLASVVSVTCLGGEVRVEHGDQARTVHDKQQVTYNQRALGDAVAIDPTVASAWQDGLLIYRDVPLVGVVADLNRYRPGRIILLNAALGENLVNGRFHINRIDDVLAQLHEAFRAHITSLPGGVVLLS